MESFCSSDIRIGISGLLALFLTILFVVKGSVMFPAAAALGWAVLVYIGIDFGFWGKVFDMSAGAERIWRAVGTPWALSVRAMATVPMATEYLPALPPCAGAIGERATKASLSNAEASPRLGMEPACELTQSVVTT